MHDSMLDHVAVRVRDRTATAAAMLRLLDWRIIEEDDRFTLLGADPDHGKLTLLDPESEDDRPVAARLLSVVLAERPGRGTSPPVMLADGLLATFVTVDELGVDPEDVPRHALVGVGLRANDPPIAAALLEREHGMRVQAVTPELAVLDVGASPAAGRITLNRERWEGTGARMLDHVGLRVQDARVRRAQAEAQGIDVVRWVEAAHSRAVFVRGPEDLLLEYVEVTAPLGQG